METQVKYYKKSIIILGLSILLLLPTTSIYQDSQKYNFTVKASSTWFQDARYHFEKGFLDNVSVTPSGEVLLAYNEKYIEDNFTDESKIIFKNNVTLNESLNELQLNNYITNTFSRIYGGNSNDYGYAIQQTNDKGYIITGQTESYGAGYYDIWLIKVDTNGEEQWNRTIGGTKDDWGKSVIETSDGGYLVTGGTESNTTSTFWADVILVKTNNSGNISWNKHLGGDHYEYGSQVIETIDGNYSLVGTTSSYGPGGRDVWFLKTNKSGDIIHNITYGTTHEEYGDSIYQTNDNGYIIVGSSDYFSIKNDDVWLIKTNETGSIQWNITFGSNNEDFGRSVEQTPDGSFIVTGYTTVANGNLDLILAKINNTGQLQWNRDYGGLEDDYGMKVIQTSDGGYLISGTTESYGANLRDIWLLKTNSTGHEMWNRTYGGSNHDYAYDIVQTASGEYVCVGTTKSPSYGPGGYNVWIFKTNDHGDIYSTGSIISKNLLDGKLVGLIKSLKYNTTLLGGAKIKVQFSQDNLTWYDSLGRINGWDQLTNGIGTIDLTNLNWKTPYFYYRLVFSSDYKYLPTICNINLTYCQFVKKGIYDSKPYEHHGKINWWNLTWSSSVPAETELKFQLRSAESIDDLSTENYLGPDGKISSYYNSSPSTIWSGHDGDTWFQYRSYFSTDNISLSPILYNSTVTYNIWPDIPKILGPANNTTTLNNKPEFSWRYSDYDSSSQKGFQLELDDSIKFDTIDFTSGPVISNVSTYNPAFSIADGIWYWHIRNCDEDGDWSLYSETRVIKIDTSINAPVNIKASPDNWSAINSFSIFWKNPDDISGIAGVYYKIDNTPYFNTDGTFIPCDGIDSISDLKVTSEGQHTVYIWLKDNLGNLDYKNTSSIVLYYDKTAPSTPINAKTDPISWANINAFNITWTNPNDLSGIAGVYYKFNIPPTWNADGLLIEGNEINSITNINVPSEGEHLLFLWLMDNAGNIDFNSRSANKLYFDLSPPKSPLNLVVSPNNWSSTNSFSVQWDNPPGLSEIHSVFYKLDEPPLFNRDGINIVGDNINNILINNRISEGEHTIFIWLQDKAGNLNCNNYSFTKLYYDSSAPSLPTNLQISPEGWTNINSFDITWDNPMDMSGISGVLYKLGSPPKHNFDGHYLQMSDISSIKNISVEMDGETQIHVWLMDKAGNADIENSTSKTLKYDSTAPASPKDIIINPRDWSYSNSFSIDWSNPSDISGLKKGAYFYMGSTPPNYQTIGTWIAEKPIHLKHFNEGEHKIYLWLEDNTGNTDYNNHCSVTIKYDKTPPENVTLMTDSKSAQEYFTNKYEVQLELSATDLLSGIHQMSFSFDNITWSTWENFTNTKNLTLNPLFGEGKKIIYLKVMDKAGNIAVASNSIVLDITPPEKLAILINNGAPITSLYSVNLKLEAFDNLSGVHQMSFSNDGVTWSVWETFATTRSYTLRSGDGLKTIHFRVKDIAGNIAEEVSTNIELNTRKPSIDTDNDNYPDFLDPFPIEPTQWMDSDGDNYGDNIFGKDPDVFPYNSSEWKDSDKDGVGDNSDYYPTDPTKWKQEDLPEVNNEDDSSTNSNSNYMILLIVIISVIIGFILLYLFILRPILEKGVKESPNKTNKEGVQQQPEEKHEHKQKHEHETISPKSNQGDDVQ